MKREDFRLVVYRMKVRKALKNSSIEELNITKQEVNREIERRNK